MKEDRTLYHQLGDLSDFVKDQCMTLRAPLREGPVDDLSEDHEGLPEDQIDRPFDEPRFFDEAMEAMEDMEAMKDIQRIDKSGKGRRGLPREERFFVSAPNCDEKLAETLSEEYTCTVTNLPEYMEGFVEGTSPLVMVKLRNGEYSAQRVLDLHGLRVDDAYELFQEVVRDAIHSNVRCVKVIHGRGLKSRNGPVLKEKLKGWILKAMHRKWVVAFASAHMRAGGPGATDILLREQPQKKRLHIIG
jgi:DNA-nicking Smr family endonuclease